MIRRDFFSASGLGAKSGTGSLTVAITIVLKQERWRGGQERRSSQLCNHLLQLRGALNTYPRQPSLALFCKQSFSDIIVARTEARVRLRGGFQMQPFTIGGLAMLASVSGGRQSRCMAAIPARALLAVGCQRQPLLHTCAARQLCRPASQDDEGNAV